MKQLVQDLSNGEMRVVDVPAPHAEPGSVLVRVAASVISAGTERQQAEFGSKNLIQKIRSRPATFRKILNQTLREGVLNTIESVQRKLEGTKSIGYSCAGTVLDVGEGVTGFASGDFVACAGGGYAVHAEIVSVPVNLAAKLPLRVGETPDFEGAAFATLGAIALQGLRLADIQVGSVVGVIGLGLVGQITIQLLKASGCRVLCTDPQADRAKLALQMGATGVATSPGEFKSLVAAETDGFGVDSVLITADGPSNQPVELAGEVCRDRGTVVVVGVVGANPPRSTFFGKELVLRISRSSGPGRYDKDYEENGGDYPIGYVRWTENRNMQAFLALLAERKIDMRPIVTHRFDIADAARAFDLVLGRTNERYLGIVLCYKAEPDTRRRIEVSEPASRITRLLANSNATGRVALGVIGCGGFAQQMLLPAFNKLPDVELVGIASNRGLSATSAARRLGFAYSSTDSEEIMQDPKINAVVIATRHGLHAPLVTAALRAGKHVFVEKPLAIAEGELASLLDAYEHSSHPIVMVGFNRRFAPLSEKLKAFIGSTHEPLAVDYRINAGYIPRDSWVHDPVEGGGRIIGELCHFVDFCSWIVGESPSSVVAQCLPDGGRYSQDNVFGQMRFPNGSIASIRYLANGNSTLSKERVEVHGGNRSGVLENFRNLQLYAGGRCTSERRWLRQDKGHYRECELFAQAVAGNLESPIPFSQSVAVTRTTFAIAESLRSALNAITVN
jgi:predicted dehydrogenase/threonine dehydrogenase-like Zn-dependent dehydrogenase